MITIIILATLMTLAMSLVAGAYKLFNSGLGEKLKTEANLQELQGWGRFGQRGFENHLETYVSFMGLAVLAVFLGDRVGVNDLMRLAVLGGWIYLIFRVAHFVCFTLSVPYLRTASWFISTFGIALIGWAVIQLAAV
ncbi:MAG: hypothetical protein CME01_11480 [Geminicoccus sp.]|nr:hypothetical protein [Geminicoccus sp.]